MAHKFQELLDKIPYDPVREERLAQMHAATLDALELGKLREQRGETQVQVAGKLATSQRNVSRIEHSENLYLSTLRDYVEALGGELEVAAVFPDARVVLVPAARHDAEAAEARARSEERLVDASRRVRESSMRVNAEFDALEDDIEP